jgi:hypothetical protein
MPDDETSTERLEEAVRAQPNGELLGALDIVLVELERRLFKYAHTDAQFQAMSDEGLVLAARAAARLGQAQSAAQHAQSHLQIVGVGEWRPSTTRPGWDADPRVTGADE